MTFDAALLTGGVLLVAFLYATVGHAGASGYIALMSLAGLAPEEIRPTALVLNILVATIGSVQFYRAGHFRWSLFWPFAVVSVPMAFVGGAIALPTAAFKVLVGVVLLLSGLTGTGGGIFLTPLLLVARWARAKEAAAVSVVFILCNSGAGLLGTLSTTRTLPAIAIPLAAAAVIGGSAGSYLGASRLPHMALKRRLAVVLVIAGLRLIDLDQALPIYYFTLACLVAVFGFLALLLRSRFGRALAGIKANEQRMRATGFSTYPYKLVAFVISGGIAGLAGFLFGVKDGFVNPELMSWHLSGSVLIMIILGGLGHLRGALVGAFAFALLQEFFKSELIFGSFAKHWTLGLGLTIIASVALLPRGLVGLPAQWRERGRHAAAVVEASRAAKR